jgi:polysaccharide chain length determinant protein (PEP-CTERM system associated)
MSVEFRQRKPSEYLKILRRRKWLIILPVIAITSAVVLVVYKLPNVYESTTLIVVRPANLPSMVVGASDDRLTRQLTSIAQVVTSRSQLEPLVERYELYKAERVRGEPMESVIGKMRNDINVTINTSRNDITNGFNIAYRYRDPRLAQAITAELAGKYISVQTSSTVNSNTSAKAFFDNQVNQAREALNEVEKRRFDFMTNHLGNLPSGTAGLFSQLSGLREQQKALMTEIGRLQDRRAAAASQLSLLKQQATDMIEEAATNLTDPKTTIAYSSLATRKASLVGELTKLKQEYRDIHPDVIAKKKEVELIQEQMDQMITDWQEKIKEKQEKLGKRPNVTLTGIQAEIDLAEKEIKRLQNALAENEKQIALMVERINNVPGVEVELAAIERDYSTKKVVLDQLMAQQQSIALGADAASQQQGEGIVVIDPANLPAQPVAPKRLMLSSIGLAIGLSFGLLLVGVFEGPRLLTIESSEDARHYTGLPVLLAVPELLTPEEARALPRRRKLLLAAGMVATIVSIPMLALALKLTHIFEYLMQASGGRS